MAQAAIHENSPGQDLQALTLPQKQARVGVVVLNGTLVLAYRKPNIRPANTGPRYDFQFPQGAYLQEDNKLMGTAARRIVGKDLPNGGMDHLEILDMVPRLTNTPLPDEFARQKGAQHLVGDWVLMRLKPGVESSEFRAPSPSDHVWIPWWELLAECSNLREHDYRLVLNKFSKYLPVQPEDWNSPLH